MKKILKKIIGCLGAGILASGISLSVGCVTSEQLNPYVLADTVSSADDTDFFISVYQAYLEIEPTTTSTSTDDSSSTSSSTTSSTDISSLLSQYTD
jgi:hypothetical protein